MRSGFLRALPPNHRASLPGSPEQGRPRASAFPEPQCRSPSPAAMPFAGPSPAARAGPGHQRLETLPRSPSGGLNAGGSRRCFPRSAGPGDGEGGIFRRTAFGPVAAEFSAAASRTLRAAQAVPGGEFPGVGLPPAFGEAPSPSLGRAPDLRAERIAPRPKRALRHRSLELSRFPGTGKLPRCRRLGVFGRRQNVLRDRISGRRTPDSPRVGLRPLGHAFRVPPGLAPELSARPSRPTFGTAPRIRVGAQIGAHSRPAPPLTRAGPSSRAS